MRPVGSTHGEAFQERTIDVTTHREEPVVSKEARLKEEVVVRKEADQRTETVHDTVRRTEVDVENERGRNTAVPSGTPPKR
jgi:stress response protein YsnF